MENSEKGGVARKSFRESPDGSVNRRSQDSLVVKCLRIPNLVSENFSHDAKKRGDLKCAMIPSMNAIESNTRVNEMRKIDAND